MPQTLRILGQANPAATTLVELYRVPTGAEARVHTLQICNQAGAGTFRIAVIFNQASLTAMHYLYYDTAIGANSVITLDDLTLGPNDHIWVYASSATMSFSAFGSEFALS